MLAILIACLPCHAASAGETAAQVTAEGEVDIMGSSDDDGQTTQQPQQPEEVPSEPSDPLAAFFAQNDIPTVASKEEEDQLADQSLADEDAPSFSEDSAPSQPRHALGRASNVAYGPAKCPWGGPEEGDDQDRFYLRQDSRRGSW